MNDESHAQALLNQIVVEHFRHQKRQRIWTKIKHIFIALMVLWGVYFYLSAKNADLLDRASPHVGVIDLKGNLFGHQAANADDFIKGLDSAYANKALKALIVRIDSPGGSAVQADYIYNAITYYRQQHKHIKVYAVCVDICASAAYYVAAAADEIYANPSSLVGSIGVLYNGFGFVDTLKKLGIARRLQTAGVNKGFLDQFSPVVPSQEKRLQTMLDLIHQHFIYRVKQGRGARLHIDDQTFSGLFWTGIQAKERGLIDGFASSGQLAREILKIQRVVDYTHTPSMVERVAKNIGTAMVDELPMALGIRSGIQ